MLIVERWLLGRLRHRPFYSLAEVRPRIRRAWSGPSVVGGVVPLRDHQNRRVYDARTGTTFCPAGSVVSSSEAHAARRSGRR